MNTHESLTQSLFQATFTAPEHDPNEIPWDDARNVAGGITHAFEPTGNAKFDALVVALNPALTYGVAQPPAYDYLAHAITMPHRDSFASPSDYLATFAHELCHWTMKRVGREPHMGDRVKYAREEQTAEIACAIVLSECGADPVLNDRADYVRGWIVGALEAQQDFLRFIAEAIGEPADSVPTPCREDVDREYSEAVERAERAAGFILSAGSLAETN